MEKNDELIIKIIELSEKMAEQGFCMAKTGLSLDEAKMLTKLIIKTCLEIVKGVENGEI